jgi:hypothetical protein
MRPTCHDPLLKVDQAVIPHGVSKQFVRVTCKPVTRSLTTIHICSHRALLTRSLQTRGLNHTLRLAVREEPGKASLMRTREGSVVYIQRQRLINELVEALTSAAFVFLPAEEADPLWADRRSFHHWLADSGLKICTTIIPSGSDRPLYKISKDLPLEEVMKGTTWGVRWISHPASEFPDQPPSPAW